jgi:hypothetical protein
MWKEKTRFVLDPRQDNLRTRGDALSLALPDDYPLIDGYGYAHTLFLQNLPINFSEMGFSYSLMYA